jgi:spermidine synthase
MKPTETLAQDRTPDGEELVLYRRDGVYFLRVGGLELMSSRAHGSEETLARLACEAIAGRKRPRMLIGGLGFGYTLRAALDHLPLGASVVVCEVFASLLEWNRDILADLAGRPLADPRVTVVQADVQSLLDGSERFDVIVLDVDNGPWAFTLQSNESLYTAEGLDRLWRSLTKRGILAVWSSAAAPEFERRLHRAGFQTRTESVSVRGGRKGPRHTLFIAQRR